MRKFIVPLLAALLGATVVPVINRSAFTGLPSAPHQVTAPSARRSSPPPAAPVAAEEPHAKAWKLLRDGRLQEAQDAFLEILSFDANDKDALHGLVVVRQSMARNDPQALRRQAAEYWNAIKRGVDTGEHYTRRAMEQLIVASVEAARELEARGQAARAPGNATRPGTPSAVPVPEDKLPSGEELLPSTGPAAKPAGPQTPPTTAKKLPPPSPSTAKRADPQKPRPSGGNVPPPTATAAIPPAAPAAVPNAPQPSTPSPGPGPRGAEVPPTSPALQKLSTGASAASPTIPTTPQAPSPSSAPVQKGAEVPPTSPALQKLPGSPAPAPQTPQTSPDSRLYTVRVGPISDRDRASAIARQLVAGGFSQTRVTTQPGFRVVSEPLPRSAAESLGTTLAGRGVHSQVEPLTGDTVQLLFGSFTLQKDAETLSRRIGAAGYDAWVREATVYTLQLGPYPQSSLNTITGIVKSGAPDATLTTTPAP